MNISLIKKLRAEADISGLGCSPNDLIDGIEILSNGPIKNDCFKNPDTCGHLGDFSPHSMGLERAEKILNLLVSAPEIADECIRLAEKNERLKQELVIDSKEFSRIDEKHQELLEELEGMKKEKPGPFSNNCSHGEIMEIIGFNQALEDVKNLIKKRGV